jgi:DnaJ-class molecular chaperone
MDLYEACQELQIWNVARAYAEVWRGTNNHDYGKIVSLARQSFKKMACRFHPDMPTANESLFLKIKEALDVINNNDVSQLFDALDKERRINVKYFKSGSAECKKCTRWNDLLGSCIFTACQGFELKFKTGGSLNDKDSLVKFERFVDTYIDDKIVLSL